MNGKNVLYSCCTWLAFQINQTYYNKFHYTWCTPYFDPPSRLNPYNSVPPTSSPREIYWNLKREIDAGDKHSAKVLQNRAGIERGADVNLKSGNIGTGAHREILEIAAAAELRDFRPLLYVIPGEPVRPLIQPVSVKDRANAFSEEYIIDRLPRHLFDAVELA